ncbi:hypothetical protein [uncultured Ruminococcus sp.]|uniref:hypothetical protein n=1 Tax=uncultured Ruminococcus sp. TaxID=165186 RepID=UPI0025E63071|nr:hypothetical protein [uncultured Ruminococcus sp.]
MKRSVRFILFSVLSIVVCWTIFTVLDYFYDMYGDMLTIVGAVMTVIAAVVCLIAGKRLEISEHPVKNIVLQLVIWNICGAVFGVPICGLVNNDRWIVHQQQGDYMSLNGIEYILFAFVITLGFSVIVILCRLAGYVFRLASQNKQNL